MLRCLCEANGGGGAGDWLNLPYNDKDPRSALHIAVTIGRLEYLQLLLWAGADVGVVDHEGRNALFYALASGHHECAELLRRRGCPDQGFVLPPPPAQLAPAILSPAAAAAAAALPPAAGTRQQTRERERERERERGESSRPLPARADGSQQQANGAGANINLAIMSPVSNRLSPKNPTGTGSSSSADRASPFAPQRTLQPLQPSQNQNQSQSQNSDAAVPPPPIHRGLHAYVEQQPPLASASAMAQGAGGLHLALQPAASSPPHAARALPPIQEVQPQPQQQPVRLRNQQLGPEAQNNSAPYRIGMQQVGNAYSITKESIAQSFEPKPMFEFKPAKARSKPRDRPDGGEAGGLPAPAPAVAAPLAQSTSTAAALADAIVVGAAAASPTTPPEQQQQQSKPPPAEQRAPVPAPASTPSSSSADGLPTGGVAMLSQAFNNFSLSSASANATLPRRGAMANGNGRVANVANIQEQLFRQNNLPQQAQVRSLQNYCNYNTKLYVKYILVHIRVWYGILIYPYC